jgi:hypothetical protein
VKFIIVIGEEVVWKGDSSSEAERVKAALDKARSGGSASNDVATIYTKGCVSW